jgi:hypothetical protein
LQNGVLSLIVGRWIDKRIEIPRQPDNEDDDDE